MSKYFGKTGRKKEKYNFEEKLKELLEKKKEKKKNIR